MLLLTAGWVLWGLLGLYVLLLLLPEKKERKRFLKLVLAFVYILVLAGFLYFPQSKLHLLWVTPIASLLAGMLMAWLLPKRLKHDIAVVEAGDDSVSNKEIDVEDEELKKSVFESLERSELRIESAIQLLEPAGSVKGLRPEFPSWWLRQENQDLNVEQALQRYIDQYSLLRPIASDEDSDVTRIAVMLAVLRTSKLKLEAEGMKNLEKYDFALVNSLTIHRTRWECKQMSDEMDKRLALVKGAAGPKSTEPRGR
jgi:hypothetical protein